MRANEGMRVQEARRCLLCDTEGAPLYHGLRDRLFGAPGTWALMQCANPTCRLVWLDPRPAASDMGTLYAQYYTHVLPNAPRFARTRRVIRNSILAGRFGYEDLVAAPLLRHAGRMLSWIGPLREIIESGVMTLSGRRDGTLLDVGCGNGQFLAKMRELGWRVFGVEPDAKAAQIARECFDLEVFCGPLHGASLPSNSFDAITMNHVLEHLHNPLDTVRECGRVLKQGGQLAVITPNAQSLGARWFGRNWRGWEIPRHLFIYSPDAIQMCITIGGLKVQAMHTTSRLAAPMWVASRYISKDGGIPGGVLENRPFWFGLEGLGFQLLEFAVCTTASVGEEILLVATK